MRRRLIGLCVAFVGCVGGCFAGPGPVLVGLQPAVAAQGQGGSTAAGNRVIVVFGAGVSPSGRASARARARTGGARTLGRSRFELVEPGAGRTVAETVAELRRTPGVVAAAPDSVVKLQSVPNDPLFGSQWGLRNTGQLINGAGGVAGADINAPLAWDRTVGSPSVVVADIDGGYRFDHPDLAPVAWTNPGEIPNDGIDNDHNGYTDDWRAWDAVDHDNNPADPGFYIHNSQTVYENSSHGVATAGIIGATGNNGVGVTGAAQNVRIMPLRACTADDVCDLSAIVEAINYAGQNGARVANLSITSYSTSNGGVMAQALGANPRTLYVAAAGNDALNADAGGNRPFPCSIDPSKSDATIGYTPPAGAVDNVLCVAATDQKDQLASFSNFGATSVDLAAPGVQTLSTNFATDPDIYKPVFNANGFADWTTTNPPLPRFTQPVVSGVAQNLIVSDGPPTLGLPETQAPGTTRGIQTPSIQISSGNQTCTFSYRVRGSTAGDDAFSWRLHEDGPTLVDRTETVPADGSPRTISVQFAVVNPSAGYYANATHEAYAEFRFSRGQAGAADAWVGIDQVQLTCDASGVLYAPVFNKTGWDDWSTPSPPATDATQGLSRPVVSGSPQNFIASDGPPILGLPETQTPGTTRATQTPEISIPPVYSTCTFSYRVGGSAAGDDRFSWALTLDGGTVFDRSEDVPTDGSERTVSAELTLPASSSPHSVRAQLRFSRGVSGAADAWVGVDVVHLGCVRPDYLALDGTSFAAPFVSGTAGLLFSLKPSASVTQVRSALLAGVDPLAALSGKTVTGGRLDAWKALAALLPMDTRIISEPSGSTTSTSATFTFDTNSTGKAGFQCQLDGGAFLPCTSPRTYTGLALGGHRFSVRSAVTGGVDTTPAVANWTVVTGGEPTIKLVGSPTSLNGRVALKLKCSAPLGRPCHAEETLMTVETLKGGKPIAVSAAKKLKRQTVVVGHVRQTISAGATNTITIRLNATGTKLLTRFHRLPVRLAVRLNGTVSLTRRLTITQKKRTKHASDPRLH